MMFKGKGYGLMRFSFKALASPFPGFEGEEIWKLHSFQFTLLVCETRELAIIEELRHFFGAREPNFTDTSILPDVMHDLV